MPPSQVGLPTVLASHRFAEVTIDKFTDSERRVSLGDLARELALRAARYDCLGKYLADDLGVPWETVIHDLPTEVKEYVTKNYRKLRRLYNHTNRAHLLELPAPSENSTLTVKSTLEENFGECIAIRAGQVQLQPENGCAQVGDVMLMHMEFAQSVKNNKGGTWTGVEIDTLHGALQQLPLLLRISGAASLEQVTDGSSLNGLLIHNLAGGSCGWTAALSLAVERFTDSSFAGVVVEKYVPEQG